METTESNDRRMIDKLLDTMTAEDVETVKNIIAAMIQRKQRGG